MLDPDSQVFSYFHIGRTAALSTAALLFFQYYSSDYSSKYFNFLNSLVKFQEYINFSACMLRKSMWAGSGSWPETPQ